MTAIRSAALGLLALTACAEMAPVPPLPETGAARAVFSAYPTAFFDRATEACLEPGRVIRPNRNEFRCESLPDLETLAAIILQFDGTVERLPYFVIALTGQSGPAGYLVTADSYIRVPQRAGGTQFVRFADAEFIQEFERILELEGGALR